MKHAKDLKNFITIFESISSSKRLPASDFHAILERKSSEFTINDLEKFSLKDNKFENCLANLAAKECPVLPAIKHKATNEKSKQGKIGNNDLFSISEFRSRAKIIKAAKRVRHFMSLDEGKTCRTCSKRGICKSFSKPAYAIEDQKASQPQLTDLARVLYGMYQIAKKSRNIPNKKKRHDLQHLTGVINSQDWDAAEYLIKRISEFIGTAKLDVPNLISFKEAKRVRGILQEKKDKIEMAEIIDRENFPTWLQSMLPSNEVVTRPGNRNFPPPEDDEDGEWVEETYAVKKGQSDPDAEIENESHPIAELSPSELKAIKRFEQSLLKPAANVPKAEYSQRKVAIQEALKNEEALDRMIAVDELARKGVQYYQTHLLPKFVNLGTSKQGNLWKDTAKLKELAYVTAIHKEDIHEIHEINVIPPSEVDKEVAVQVPSSLLKEVKENLRREKLLNSPRARSSSRGPSNEDFRFESWQYRQKSEEADSFDSKVEPTSDYVHKSSNNSEPVVHLMPEPPKAYKTSKWIFPEIALTERVPLKNTQTSSASSFVVERPKLTGLEAFMKPKESFDEFPATEAFKRETARGSAALERLVKKSQKIDQTSK